MLSYGTGIFLGTLDQIPLSQLREWRNDFRVWKWCRQYDLISRDDHCRWESQLSTNPSIQMYSIFNGSKQGMGVCGFTGIDLVNRHAEFSLYIAPTFWGQGYGKKALQSLVSHGFNSYGFQVIWGESFAHNPATKMFVQLGFMHEGIRRNLYFREGKFIDAHLYSILREDWESQQSFEGYREQLCSI